MNRSADAERIITFGTAWQTGRVIAGALQAGVFDLLAQKAHSAEALAGALRLDAVASGRALRVLQAADLVSRRGAHYRLRPSAKTYLCSHSPHYLGHFLLHADSLQEQWGGLNATLATGRMLKPSARRLAGYRRQLKLFLAAMDNLGRLKAAEIAEKFAIGSYGSMLDIGGGLGTYARQLVQRRRSLRATVFELADVARYARRAVRDAGLADRVRVAAGRCLADPLPAGPFDLVLLSNVLHIYGPDDCRRMVAEAAAVLAPGGTLLVHEYIIGCGDPLAVALFDMTMLVGTPGGRCPEKKELSGWLRSAGVRNIQSTDVTGGTAIVWGRKAGS